MFHLYSVINSSDDPGHPKSQEDVDGVTSGHIPDRVVRVSLVDCCSFASKGVRQGGAESHKSNSRDFILQTDETSKDRSQVSDDNDNKTNEGKRGKEAGPATHETRGRDDGEDELESKGEEVHDVICSIKDYISESVATGLGGISATTRLVGTMCNNQVLT